VVASQKSIQRSSIDKFKDRTKSVVTERESVEDAEDIMKTTKLLKIVKEKISFSNVPFCFF